MGLEVSQEAVPEPNIDRTTFNYNRYLGVWPALFESNKTAVTVDVLETGLILAFVMLAFCFYIVLPGIRGKEVSGCLSVYRLKTERLISLVSSFLILKYLLRESRWLQWHITTLHMTSIWISCCVHVVFMCNI